MSLGFLTLDSYNPEQLNNTIINSLGKRYLDNRAKENQSCFAFFYELGHHNHSVAKELQNYNQQSTAYEKWLFLASVYNKLSQSNGELGDAIILLFESYFSQKSNFRKKYNSYLLANDIHNAKYFTHQLIDENSKERISLALKMIVSDYYIRNDELQTKVKFPEAGSDTTSTQPQRFASFSEISSVVHNNPFALTGDLVKQIGILYDRYFPSDSFAVRIGLHSNHFASGMLTATPNAWGSYQCWMKLANTYATLKGSYGALSKAILDLFHQAFHFSVCTYKVRYIQNRYHDYAEKEYFPTAEVSTALKGIVNLYYQNYYHQLQFTAVETDTKKMNPSF